MICGAVAFDHPAAHHLVALLPRIIRIEAWSSPEVEWLQSTLRFIAAEAREMRPGGEAIITRLVGHPRDPGDPLVDRPGPGRPEGVGSAPCRIGRSAAPSPLVHREPARAWSVSSLAAEAAMSRSAFAARFTAARRRAGDALRGAVADARRPAIAQGGRGPAGRTRGSPGLPIGSGVQPGVQAVHGRVARRRSAQPRSSARPCFVDRPELSGGTAITPASAVVFTHRNDTTMASAAHACRTPAR